MKKLALAFALLAVVAAAYLLLRGPDPAPHLVHGTPPHRAPGLEHEAPASPPGPDLGAGRAATATITAERRAPAPLPRRAAEPGAAIEGAWGGAPGQFGRRRDSEANPEAPMAVVARGRSVYVVDQVNHRVQRFEDGRPAQVISTSETIQDLAVGADGKTVVLDRLADKSVQVFDANGELVNEAPLEGKGIPEAGRVTGVFRDEGGIWVERDHSSLVRIADADGNADAERPELPGRPTRDGRVVVSVVILDRAGAKAAVTAFQRETLELAWRQDVVFSMPIVQILMVDSDLAGNVYVAAHVGRESDREPYMIVEEVIQVVKLGTTGELLGSIDLPASSTGDENLRPLSVGDDGAIYAMQPTEAGMTVGRYEVR